jgi:hypothetical protein
MEDFLADALAADDLAKFAVNIELRIYSSRLLLAIISLLTLMAALSLHLVLHWQWIVCRKEWEGPGATTIQTISKQHTGGVTEKKGQRGLQINCRSRRTKLF